MIQFVQTKSSKARGVPITDELEKSLKAHHKDAGDGERLFTTAYAAFRKSLYQAKLKLSVGQLTHILRHTFASQFMMNGGNMLALQKVLGHHSLTMTMRYAHLPPRTFARNAKTQSNGKIRSLTYIVSHQTSNLVKSISITHTVRNYIRIGLNFKINQSDTSRATSFKERAFSLLIPSFNPCAM